MMRPAAFRRPHVAAIKPSSIAHQRRSKMFLRNEDANGDIYYTVDRRAFPPKPIEAHDLFAIGDLLLDLEAEDSKSVRQFSEKDETQMQKSWKVDHTRRRIEKRVQELESQVNWSRQKVFKITNRPTNIWRPRTCDVFSVALSTSHLPLNAAKARQEDDSGRIPPASLTSLQEPHTTKTLCSENGFSNRISENDEMLLSWLKLRQKLLESGREHEPSPSARDVKEALGTKTSIISIRRLISQSLSSGLSTGAFQKGLSSEIRDALIKVLDQSTSKDSGRLQILTFLSNLKERLSLDGSHIGAPLCGLGLKLSAEIANPEAATEYLGLGFTHNLWRGNSQVLEDVVSALRVFEDHLRTPSEARPLDSFDQQTLLLQVLTGVGEEDGHSIRSLVTFLSKNPSERDQQQVLQIYRCYILLLGKLGAVRTLWKEWRETAPYLASQENGPSRSRSEHLLEDTFAPAIRASLPIVARIDWGITTNIDFDECVAADYQATEALGANHWSGSQQKEAQILEGLKDGDCREALELPIDNWLEAIGRLARRMSP